MKKTSKEQIVSFVLKNPFIKKSEIAKKMGISNDLLFKKINNIQRNKLSEKDVEKILIIKFEIMKILKS